MREINYQLIISDFDGTLLDSTHQVPEKVKNKIHEYIQSGGKFVVCTGRMLRSILPRVRALGLTGLVVAYQGTYIADIESGKIIRNGGMPASDVAEICKCIESYGGYCNVYNGDELYTDMPSDDKYLISYQNITGVVATEVPAKPMSQFVLDNNLFCQKVTSLVPARDRDKLYCHLKDKLSKAFDVTCSADVLVEVSPYGDNKGVAVEYIANYYNIPIEKTIALGDNLNDLSMIKVAGIGVAVGNATEELKKAANLVTLTNDEGGVAEIIEKYGFKN
jgi:Cof subfamily protein (haloacid dehalogenase superfamily)